jgi:hypothetical protein
VNTLDRTKVAFLPKDIVHPIARDVLWQLYAKDLLHGEVLAETNDGWERASFLVVRMEGVKEPIIVRADKALPCD